MHSLVIKEDMGAKGFQKVALLDTCQRVILLSHGAIAADGDAEVILRDKALLEANRMELPFCLQGWHR